MNIYGLAGHRVILTVAILFMTPLNVSNVSRNEAIQSTRPIRLSVLLTTDAALWMGPVIVLILKMPLFVASSSRAAWAVITPGVPSWSDGVSWVIQHVRVCGHH